MEIKTFEALTMSDAIKAIKDEFGSDAVILKTREKADNNYEGRKIIEITAAKPISSRNISGASVDINLIAKDLKSFDDKISLMNLKLANISELVAQKSHLYSIETSLDEIKMILLDVLAKNDGERYKDLPKSITSLDQYLRVMGVDELNRINILNYLTSLPQPSEQDLKQFESIDAYYKLHAMKWMMKKIKISPQWSVVKGVNTVHVFFGSTGCGKTSTIAKLAYLFSKKHKAKVLVISCDSSRLAASDQLRVYSKIIDIPFEEISSYSEITEVLKKYNQVQLVFLDTSGINPKNKAQIQALEELKKINLVMENHLVLSTTEKEIQLERSIRSFSVLGIQSVIFTKLDESWSYGEIFNIGIRWSLPLSYFSVGQKIPEDIERASRERVIERIFGR